MSTAAPPTIPPRPTRSQNKAPEIPPRPAAKRIESPSQKSYQQSPFNEPLGRSLSNNVSDLNLARPPSVTLPSIGQEGNEYADLQYDAGNSLAKTNSQGSEKTRHIGGNLPMHAPKPSHPASMAKAQVQAVTRTDSSQAAAHGLGKAATPVPDDPEPEVESLARLKSKSSFSRPGSSSSSIQNRRSSVSYEDDQPPSGIGLRVPINPYLGDVQAPSPAPGSEVHLNAHHAHHGGQRKHHRTRSGREVFLPPDSYGLHGHGMVPVDKFEKDWYAKHPGEFQRDKEEGYYHGIGSGRGESALSSEELNKLVRQTHSRGAGFGTSSPANCFRGLLTVEGSSAAVPGYPDEQVGYIASEQYSSRVASPATAGGLYKLNSNSSQPQIESPLRKTSFPADILDRPSSNKTNRPSSMVSDKAVESDTEEDAVHVSEPSRKYNKITGGQGSIEETANLGPSGGNEGSNGGYIVENGYGIPILASDEVAKEVGGEHLQPAVPPSSDRRQSFYDEYGSGTHTPRSRPSSRPSSMHGAAGLSRFISHQEDEHTHTPLADVEEYEPLFPEEDESKKPLTAADRFKQRPGNLKHRFPSQDIWEDAPNSQLHVATVSTPDLPVEQPSSTQHETAFETPEQEGARKGETTEAEKAKLIPKEERLAKSKFAPHLRDDMPTRPGIQNRFPSQDIWEDSPDSVHLVTTVSTPPGEDGASPVEAQAKPTIPPRPVNRTKMGETEPSVPPTVPGRPPRRLHQVPAADAQLTSPEKQSSPVEGKKAPVLPDRPKPQVPARPTRKESGDELTKTTSAVSAGSVASDEAPVAAKAKPAVPARPVGGKIANLRAGFMSDLNKRLQIGQQGPPAKEKEPEPEVEEEKAPLSDARKGRARGPQRRKPAASPSAQPAGPTLRMVLPQSLWHISNDDDVLTVHSQGPVASEKESSSPAAEVPPETSGDSVQQAKAGEEEEHVEAEPPASLAAPLARNMAGETPDPSSLDTADATPRSEKGDPLDKSPATLARSTGLSAPPQASPLSKAQQAEGVQKADAGQEDSADLESTKTDVASPEAAGVNEKDLENLTAIADGKKHSPVEDSVPSE